MPLSPDIRIAIADDRPIFRDGLRKLLDDEPGLAVVGIAALGDEAIAVVSRTQPDILVMSGGAWVSSTDLLHALAGIDSPVRTVLFARAATQTEAVAAALKLGAVGFVAEDAPTNLLLKCIRAVMAGELWVGREAVSGLVEALRRLSSRDRRSLPPRDQLTPRERDVIREVTEGATNKDIAAKFALSEQTVKNHLSNIFDKLGVSSRLELALYAVNHQLLDDAEMPRAS